MPGHFTPPEANLYYTMVYILPAEILFNVLAYVGIGTYTSYLQVLMFQPPQLRQHIHLPTRPTPNRQMMAGSIKEVEICVQKEFIDPLTYVDGIVCMYLLRDYACMCISNLDSLPAGSRWKVYHGMAFFFKASES